MARTLLVAAVLAVLVTSAFGATGDLTLPTWPKPFDLTRGDSTTFYFPITQAGQVVVDVVVDKGNATMILQEPKSKAQLQPASMTTKGTDTKYTYNFADADVAKSATKTWSVVVTAHDTASGSVSVKTPAVDQKILRAALAPILGQQQAAIKALQARLAGKLKTASTSQFAALEKTRLADIAKAGKLTIAAMRLESQRQVALLHAVTPPKILINNAALRMKGVVVHPIGGTGTITPGPTPGGGGTPTITGVTPSKAAPGTMVHIGVTGLGADFSTYMAVFKLHYPDPNGSTRTVSVESRPTNCAAGDPVNVTVPVPFYPSATANDDNAQVKLGDGTTSTPFVPFKYVAPVLPVITSAVAPDGLYRPGSKLVVSGANFPAGIQVLFAASYIMDTPVTANVAPGTTPSATSISVTIPSYDSDSRFQAYVQIAYPNPNPAQKGNQYTDYFPVTLEATHMTLTGMDHNSGSSGAWIKLTGKGFGETKGEAKFGLPPKGDYAPATVVEWHDTSVLVVVPDVQGISSNYLSQVYLRLANGNMTGSLQFTIIPITEHRQLNLQGAISHGGYRLPVVCTNGDNQGGHDGYQLTSPTQIAVHHYACDWWSNGSATDVWFPSLTLKNGWTVEAVHYSTYDCEHGSAGVTKMPTKGSTQPEVDVAYSVDSKCFIESWACYGFSIDIQGPKGCLAGDE